MRPTSSKTVRLALLICALFPLAGRAGVLTGNCVVGDRPAATLLFPYFEVDLANAAGTTTLISISARDVASPVLARVVMWTDWRLATYEFTLFLRPNDVQTINLRDVFATAKVPVTGPGADVFPGCNPMLGGGPFGWNPDSLQGAHAGRDNGFGACFSSGSRGPNIATGYITVDHVVRCSEDPWGFWWDHPGPGAYFGGANPMASNQNVLWGDWLLVTPGQAFASGHPAVHIQADPDFFGPGDHTFYGHLIGFSGADERRPLPSRYDARFLIGGGFTGGTRLIVWRAAPYLPNPYWPCGSKPPWVPLGERQVRAHDEAGATTSLGTTAIFDLATQRVDITSIPQPYTFGFLDLNLNRPDNEATQAWVGVEASAAGLYSAGFAATPINDLCAVKP